MKTESRTATKEPGPRGASVPASATNAESAPPAAVDAATLEAELAALAQEEEILRKRREERRAQYWSLAIGSITRTIDQLAGFGFDLGDVGKALGFPSSGKGATPKKGTGPKTHDGWYALFLTGGVQSYLKAHPDLAAKLKADQVSRDQYRGHIPPDDLKPIEEAARHKAETKCPRVIPTSEAPSR